MVPRQATRLETLNRQGWLLWGLTFAVVLALTVAVPFLYLPMLQVLGSEQPGVDWVRDGYYAVIGLSGLVVIFCLYTALKQIELNRMRHVLDQEARELEDVRARLSELSALFQVSTTLNLQFRLEVILEIIVRRVVSTLRAQQASVMIMNPETGVLETRACYGLEAEYARNARRRLGEGIAGWVAERKEAVLLNQAQPRPEFEPHYKKNRNITSALSLPLRVGERCVGVLNVNRINHPEVFQERHRDMLRLFAEHVGAVIDRAEAMDRLGDRARQLEADNLKLSELNRMKDVFLSTASHELKTPLTAVIAYAELLEEHEGRLSPEKQGEFLRRLRAEGMRLLGLIDDILDLSRLESGKMVLKRQPLLLNEVARGAVETARTVADRQGVELVECYAEDLPETLVDEVKMRQVLVNLLVNAVKFSPDHGRVTVTTTRDGDFARVEVRDQGPGIEPDETAHIFELFGQGERPSARGMGGLGIGLHLVRRITELHGGRVGVNSRPGEGSAFWVEVPLLARLQATAQEVGQAA